MDHFSVLRLIGRGGMGEVYLARDMLLGRKVALKVLNAKHIGSAAMVESLMEEARITARFSHPHIVMIHAVGEHEESPYLALEYLEGQPLRERLRQERPGKRESLRIILAIAEALATAHQGGVLHLDLKPGNVFLPRDGRIRVLDFGIARRSSTAVTWDSEEPPASDDSKTTPVSTGALLESGDSDDPNPKKVVVLGTPAYLSPETWSGAPAQAARDLWALGVIAHELLTGRHPYPGLKRTLLRRRVCSPDPVPPLGSQEISSEVKELIAGLLSKDPQGRPPAQEVVNVLHKQLHPSRAVAAGEGRPFRGLQPFSERHADLFFGREAEVGAFLERLRQESVLPVVGPSGAGKSSFVQAGVIPRLREQGAWRVLSMRPGQQPFMALAGRLTGGATSGGSIPSPDDVPTVASEDLSRDVEAPPPVDDSETLARELRASPMLLSLRLLEYAKRLGSRVLLFVDQLEELYTLVEDELERQAFMQAVCAAADDPQGPVRVIFTVRDDFLVRLAEGAAARDAFSRVTVLRSPGSDALAEILVRPVELAGYRYEDPDMVPQMIESIQGEPSSLPLLQFAAHTLWDRRDRKERMLKLASYEAMGGVAGALAEHADGVLAGMVPDQLAMLREVLLRLVTPQRTRRVVARSRLVEGLADEAESVVRVLVEARLLSVRRGVGAEPVLELAHESLIQGWTQLARWLEEGREDLVFLAEVGQAAELWERRGRRGQEVWHDDALHDALRSLDRCTARVPEAVRGFLESGRAREAQIRRRKRLWSYSGIAVLVLVAAISTLATFVIARGRREARQQRQRAEEQKRQAEKQRQRARMRWAEAQREGARAALQRGDQVGASAKLRGSLEMGDSSLARALWWALKRSPLKWRKDLGAGIYSVACAPDGKTVAVASMSHAVYLVDTRTLQVRVLRGHNDQALNVIFARDGRRVISSSMSGEVFVWSVHTGRIVRRLAGHTRSVRGLALSPDGERLATGSYDHTVRIWDLKTGKMLRMIRGTLDRIFSVAYAPGGAQLYASSTRGRIFEFDPRTGAQLRVLRSKKGSVLTVAVSPDGRRLASASTDLMVRLWRLPDGTLERELRGHVGPVSKVTFSPDGRLLASGGGDQTVRVWRAATGKVLMTFREHKRGVRGLTFCPDGAGVLSGSMDHALRLWRVRPTVARSTRNAPAKAVRMIAFSPDSKQLASGGGERDVQLWDLARGTVKEVLTGHTHAVFSLAFSPDGKRLASGSEDRTVRLWSLSDGQRPLVLAGHRGVVESLVFGPRGKQLWSASWDGTIRLWDAASARQLRVLRGHAGTVQEIALNRASTRLASASNDKTVRLWDAVSGRQLRVLRGHSRMVYGVTFSPDGQRLATGGADQSLWLWRVATGQGRPFGKHPGRIYYLHFHPGGQKLGVPYSDGTARIWDLRTGRYVELLDTATR